ncbi:MAG: protein translocase subunit SecD [Patescibacteria group bacterium]|nr:protein translocase subunit SecD [Patescibacteria group bacterium]
MMSQKNKIKLALLGIFLMAILAIVLDFSQYITKSGIQLPSFINKPFRLGLDLQGGTHLIYQADVTNIPSGDQSSAVEGVRDVIERRVNAFGVGEPVVEVTNTSEGWRVIVELAGVSDINQAIKMIGETPLLEFKEQNPNPQISLTEDQKKQLAQYNEDAKKRAEEVLQKIQAPGADFSSIAQQYSEDAGSKANGGDLGYFSRGNFVAEFEKACFDDLKSGETSKSLIQSAFGYHIIQKVGEQGSGDTYKADCRHILIKTKTEADFINPNDQWSYTGLTGKQLTRAQVVFDPNSHAPQISLEFNTEGKDLFGTITKRNISKPIAIFLDGQMISSPTVQEPIVDGKAVINGKFTIVEAKLLAQRLNAGALPVPITLISQQTIGASLGNESVRQSVNAGIIGLLIVALFMILYYRLPGVAATIALIFYALILAALFKIINVTLTLAGIAGFILSLGMAVDANILIFERLKEELRRDKPLSAAIDEGFKRAWPSIFDGNLSTIITCLILMSFTTSSVKGFAITLTIGILVSMFSAMTVTRVIIKTFIKSKALNSMWLFGISSKKNS